MHRQGFLVTRWRSEPKYCNLIGWKPLKVIEDHLSVCSCHVIDENEPIKEQLAGLSCDRVSDISKMYLDNVDHPWIIPNNILKLNITNSKMTNDQFENLIWIQSLTKLHFLNLTGNELTDIPNVKLAVSGSGSQNARSSKLCYQKLRLGLRFVWFLWQRIFVLLRLTSDERIELERK